MAGMCAGSEIFSVFAFMYPYMVCSRSQAVRKSTVPFASLRMEFSSACRVEEISAEIERGAISTCTGHGMIISSYCELYLHSITKVKHILEDFFWARGRSACSICGGMQAFS